jgi:hypothetical protein
MGPLSGTAARLAGVLLSVVAVSCSAGVPPVSSQPGTPGPIVTPKRMTGSPTPEATGPLPALSGCPAGTVTIAYQGPGDWSVCVRAGARLRLTLPDDNGYGTWAPLHVTPPGAAAVSSNTDPKGNVRVAVTPAGTSPFCLGTNLAPTSPTAPDFPWHLCVAIRR